MHVIQTRVADWRTRLLRFAHEQVGRPFIWGETDCAVLTRRAMHEMFGRDAFPQLPEWHSLAEAVRVSRMHGRMGKILERAGAGQVPLGFIRAGDVVVLAEPDEPAGRESIIICVDKTQCLVSTRDGVFWGVPKAGTVYSLWELTTHG